MKKLWTATPYVLPLLALLFTFPCFGQNPDYAGTPDAANDPDQEPVLFISLSAGPSIPQGTLSNDFEFRDAPSGFAQTGMAADFEVSYNIDPAFGLTAKYRYSRFEQNENAIAADLTRNKIGDFTADINPWQFHLIALGPHFSLNNNQSFLNVYIAPAYAFASLPRAVLRSKVDYHNTSYTVTHNNRSSSSVVFLMGTSFKYIFNKTWGISMSVDYVAGRIAFEDIQYESPDSVFEPDFEDRLNVGYTAISAQAGIFFYLSKTYN